SSNRVFMPAERTTSTSSMLSAPAHIPPIRVASFGAGLADPDLILVSAMCTFSPRSPARPVCSASVITGTSPAHDTRLSSSNTAESAMKLCYTCTGSAFLKPVRLLCGNSNHPSSEGTFLISTHAHPVNRSVDRGLGRDVELPCPKHTAVISGGTAGRPYPRRMAAAVGRPHARLLLE